MVKGKPKSKKDTAGMPDVKQGTPLAHWSNADLLSFEFAMPVQFWSKSQVSLCSGKLSWSRLLSFDPARQVGWSPIRRIGACHRRFFELKQNAKTARPPRDVYLPAKSLKLVARLRATNPRSTVPRSLGLPQNARNLVVSCCSAHVSCL